MYPHERQVEYWISRAIEEYFENEGHSVVAIPNSQRNEKFIPYDHLFAGDGVKIFGLQYKRLCPGSTDHWKIDRGQYLQLRNFDWILYALPQVRSIREHRNALHLTTIVNARALESILSLPLSASASSVKLAVSELSRIMYYRWGGFVQALYRCHVGWLPADAQELRYTLRELDDLVLSLIDVFMVPLGRPGPVVRYTPYVSEIAEDDEGLDFGLQ